MAAELELVLADSRARLLDAGLTRIAAIQSVDVPADWNSEWSSTSRLAWGAAKAIGRGISRLTGSPGIDLKHQEAEGVVDLAGRRYTLVHSWMAQVGVAGTCWTGAPGDALSDELVDDVGLGQPGPLWFTDLLIGAYAITDTGSDYVRGAECRRLNASVDLHRVAAESAEAVWVPERTDYRELAALPIAVWIDGAGDLRRVRFFTSKESSRSLELWDHGSVPELLDWTRLP